VLPAFGLYTHIQANRRRSAVLILGLFVLFYLMTFGLTLLVLAEGDEGSRAFADLVREAASTTLYPAGPIVTILVGLWVWIALRFNEWLLNLTTGSDPLERGDDPGLYNLLENLCISRGLATPKLRILETEAPNAFASGIRPDQQTITVTRGLLDALDERELEAVLAHELTHIRNGDVRTMVIAVVIVGIMSYVGELTRNPDAMISPLRKIEGKGELEGVPSAVMELCVDNPRSGFADLFATHPSIDQRVDALVRYAGGRAADEFAAQIPQQAPAA
jgi:heat shock protein HtpX